MTSEYCRSVLRISVAQLCQNLGWNSTQSTSLELLTDVMERYILELGNISHRYCEQFGRTEVNLDDIGLGFQQIGVSLDELTEYITHVEPVPFVKQTVAFPAPKRNNLQFPNPQSREILQHREGHIPEYLPHMFPGGKDDVDEPAEVVGLVPEFNTSLEVSPAATESRSTVTSTDGPPTKRPRICSATLPPEADPSQYEMMSVTMSQEGELTPKRQGKLPDNRTPPAGFKQALFREAQPSPTNQLKEKVKEKYSESEKERSDVDVVYDSDNKSNNNSDIVADKSKKILRDLEKQKKLKSKSKFNKGDGKQKNSDGKPNNKDDKKELFEKKKKKKFKKDGKLIKDIKILKDGSIKKLSKEAKKLKVPKKESIPQPTSSTEDTIRDNIQRLRDPDDDSSNSPEHLVMASESDIKCIEMSARLATVDDCIDAVIRQSVTKADEKRANLSLDEQEQPLDLVKPKKELLDSFEETINSVIRQTSQDNDSSSIDVKIETESKQSLSASTKSNVAGIQKIKKKRKLKDGKSKAISKDKDKGVREKLKRKLISKCLSTISKKPLIPALPDKYLTAEMKVFAFSDSPEHSAVKEDIEESVIQPVNNSPAAHSSVLVKSEPFSSSPKQDDSFTIPSRVKSPQQPALNQTEGGTKETGKKETGKKEMNKTDTNKKETGKKQTGKKEASKNEFSKKATGKTETSKIEFSKKETGKTEASKAESSKKETGKTEASKAESRKKETGKTEAITTESSKKETGKTESSKVDNETSKKETGKTETSKKELGKTEDVVKTGNAKTDEKSDKIPKEKDKHKSKEHKAEKKDRDKTKDKEKKKKKKKDKDREKNGGEKEDREKNKERKKDKDKSKSEKSQKKNKDEKEDPPSTPILPRITLNIKKLGGTPISSTFVLGSPSSSLSPVASELAVGSPSRPEIPKLVIKPLAKQVEEQKLKEEKQKQKEEKQKIKEEKQRLKEEKRIKEEKEKEIERQKEIEREKERQKDIEREKERQKDIDREKERQKEKERLQKEQEREKELELEKERKRKKEEEQRELEKEKERQKQREFELKLQKELELKLQREVEEKKKAAERERQEEEVKEKQRKQKEREKCAKLAKAAKKLLKKQLTEPLLLNRSRSPTPPTVPASPASSTHSSPCHVNSPPSSPVRTPKVKSPCMSPVPQAKPSPTSPVKTPSRGRGRPPKNKNSPKVLKPSPRRSSPRTKSPESPSRGVKSATPVSPASDDIVLDSSSGVVAETVGTFVDAAGNQIWICPACKMQDDGSPMIGCDGCPDWYHWVCVNIVQEPPEDEEWFCPRCRQTKKAKPKLKRKRKKLK